MAEWYYIYRGATDRRLALKFVDYKSNRQSYEARAVIIVSFYCFRNPLRIQGQNRWCTGGRAALQPSRGFRGISSPEGLRYSTVPLTAAPSCVGRPCRLRGTQQTGSTSVIGKPVYAGGPLRAGAGDGREGGALPHTPASPENSFRLFAGRKNIDTNFKKEVWWIVRAKNICYESGSQICFRSRNGVTYTGVGLT